MTYFFIRLFSYSAKLFCFLLLLPFGLLAQHAEMASIHFNADNGLPSSEVYDILQDKAGYIWVATDNGISRYNGYAFQHFGPGEGLLDNVVFSLYEDTKGRIWMSTLSEKLYYYEQDTIRPADSYNEVLKQYKSKSYPLKDYFIDQQGTFCGAIPGQGIIKIFSDGQHELIRPPELDCHKLLYQHEDRVFLVQYRCADKNNKAKEPQEVNLFLYKEGEITNYTSLIKGHKLSLSYSEAYYLSQGKILYIDHGHIYCFDDDKLEKAIPLNREIIDVQETADGSIYLGLGGEKGNEGVLVYKGYEDLLANKATSYLERFSVSEILEDEAGGLWLGTNENGIYYIPNPDAEIYSRQSGLSDNFITAVSLKNEQEVFLGLDNGDVYYLHLKKQQLHKFPANYREVYDLQFDHQSKWLWLGASSGLRYSKQDFGPFLSYVEEKVLPYQGYRKFNIYPPGLLLGSSPGPNGVITEIDTKNGILNFSIGPVPPKRTFSVYKDFNNRIWVGRIDGLFELKDSILMPASSHHPAFKLRIEDIAQLADSTLVIGTKGAGIILWKGSHFIQIDHSEGLTTSTIEKIHIDAAQQIWVGTLNGLNRIRLSDGGPYKITNFTVADGLPSNEITDITSWGTDIWAATTQGAARLPFGQQRHYPPRVPIIAEVLVNNESLKKDKQRDWPYWKSNVQFNFFAIDYQQNGKINYRYRLRSSDEWTTTQILSVNYAALSPDAYQFEVQAANKNGEWSTSAVFPFTIRAPFWKTGWFLSLCMLSIGGIIYYLYRNQIRQIENRAILEVQVNELRQSALRAQMNPHFIFNCLNSIQGYIAGGDSRAATLYLARFSRLIRSVLNTSVKHFISLEEEIDMLKNYIELERLRMKHPFSYAIEVDPALDTFDTLIPPLLVQPLVENAIIHGLSKLETKGHLEIVYALAADKLKVNVRDNGVGLKKALNKERLADHDHQSLGMGITRKRLELLDEETKAHSYLEVKDIAGENGLSVGTCATILIARKKDPINVG